MKSFKEIKRNLKQNMDTLPGIRIALMGDSSTQFLATAIRGEGYDRGYNIILYESDYNQTERQALDPTSEYHQFAATYTIIFLSTHKLLEKYSLSTAAEQLHLADERIELIKELCGNIEGTVICFNYPEIDDSVFGSYANKVPLSFTYQLRKLNYDLMKLSSEIPNLFICDIAALQNKFGRDFIFDSHIYVSTEMLLSLDSIPYIASRCLDIVSAVEGKFKKCLILDLDNTLWGGVVGDDGWERIQIGHNLGIGKVYTEIQEWVKKLKNRGIIIAVCSKNDEDKAKEPFEKNPEMILRLEDISVFIANWDNKVNNIKLIQSILNIGFDSMVFLDDNPFERNLVRENIPGIIVPELPDDPGDYLEYLYSLNLFETASYSETDSKRTEQYRQEAVRVSQRMKFTDEADYLKSLDMKAKVEKFNDYNTPRIAQLSQRSNQFNLRTVRYTENDIIEMRDNAEYACFAFSLSDKYGDNGLISVVIMKVLDAKTLFIDTWFMSCRVLKRGMENFILDTIAEYAKDNGYHKLIGEYIPTAKNGMVKNLYTELGFTESPNNERNEFELNTSSYKTKICFIQKED